MELLVAIEYIEADFTLNRLFKLQYLPAEELNLCMI